MSMMERLLKAIGMAAPQSPFMAAELSAGTLEAAQAAGLKLNETPFRRAGWLIVWLGVAGFLLWAALAPLDKGVPASGTVKVSGNRKAVQSAVDGSIKRLLVRDGDQVRFGQPILMLDETPARTQADSLRIQLATARATTARLVTERDGTDSIAFPSELVSSDVDARVAAAVSMQRQLLQSRRMALESELNAMRETEQGYLSSLRGLTNTLAARRQQEQALREQAAGLRALATDGYVSRNRLLDTERLLAEVVGDIAENAGRVGQLQRQVAEQRLRIAQRQEQHQAEVRAQLADATLEAEALSERLAAAEYELRHTEVLAPATGTIVGLSVFTEGGFIRAGNELMHVVPSGGALVVEGQVPVNLIDTVHAGLPVEMMFTAFNQNTTPRVPGEVRVVGADRLVDERTGIPYYPIEVAVTDEGLEKLTGLDLRPGMPVEVFVRTGERSLLSYLFKPLIDRAHTALGEE